MAARMAKKTAGDDNDHSPHLTSFRIFAKEKMWSCSIIFFCPGVWSVRKNHAKLKVLREDLKVFNANYLEFGDPELFCSEDCHFNSTI